MNTTLTIRTKIALLAFGLVLSSILAGSALVVGNIFFAMERELGQRALFVARTVAQLDEIRENLRPGGARLIQPVAERIRLATGVEYIVVIDMNRTRYSHPMPSRIGSTFGGGDEGPALTEQSYYSRAFGVLGPSVRAFVPVMSPGENLQVGVVVVGLLVPAPLELVRNIGWELSLSLVAGVAVGLVGAWLLASNIKRQMFNLEPSEIARLLEERVAIFHAIGEGLIAIDRDSRITIINEEAQRIIGVTGDAVDRPIREVIPNTKLPETLATGQPELNQQMLLGQTVVIVNRVPIRVKGQIVGAVATFRDRTELNRLAEELTGVMKFVESLRVQNHEHLNKLHTIAGLIQLKKYEQAIDFIFSATEQQQRMASFLARRFCDHRVSGLLLGKLSRAKELGIDMKIEPGSRLKELPKDADASSLVIILGNLLENSMDALMVSDQKPKQIRCLIDDSGEMVRIVVSDNGSGINLPDRGRIFEPGFSTRGGSHQGIGLTLVKQHVDGASGSIRVETGDQGTTFEIELPKDSQGGRGEEGECH